MDISVGLSTEKDPVSAAIEATKLASIKIHEEKISLAIVFSSIDLSYPKLLKTITISLERPVPIVGCSGAAIISNQGVFKHGVVVMLLSFSKDVYFKSACVKNIKTKTALKAGIELGDSLLYGFKNAHRLLSLIFSDGLIDEGSNLIAGLQGRLGKSFPLVGASAADDMRFLKTYLYFNQELLKDSAIGILWGGKLNFGLGIKHGWKPLGKPRTVTKSRGNIVYEIDGAAAIKIYEEYLNRNPAELKKDLRRISVLYPIGIYIPGEEEYLLRNILSMEDNGSLRCQGNVNEGSSVRLMIGTRESCLNATRAAVNEAKKRLLDANIGFKKRQGMKNFVLVLESASRYILLRREINKELEIIKKGLGEDTPIIGLCTYGEQAPLRAISYQGQAYFHNQTIAILTIGG
ncbi:MAG: FIST C-terminal domain-containing protein [Candidatus Omnitrophica bacterium]|nr:FIST C-terminal domain-containing protein [Candidatus Omnitrophota bacterium]MBU4346655.1 FIST C-terminal domain-containing protein [Candidatus Omnitrophota bacterium]MBU4472993.1 FIST C-terminal domain-containing protein [Candidatus Omnitrophota bacterium]MCG2706809.1 FIST C-terminal domain-containing protein [Candidatus Omnitrophota bacterium]